PVMAHGPGVTPAAIPQDHPHPLNTAIVDNPLTVGVTETVAAHNGHPMVTSIALKPVATKTRGNTVVVTDPSDGTAADAQFTLVITFDRDVVPTSTVRAVPTAAADRTAEAALMGDGDISEVLLDADGTASDATAAFGNSTRPATGGNSVEVVVAISTAFPTATEAITLRLRVDANAVFSLATLPELTEVPGGNSLASALEEFTLVMMLPDPGDTTAPVPTVMAPSMPDADGNLVFNINFDDAVTGFSLGDVMVTNGTKQDFSTKANGSFDVTITPDSADSRVTVSVPAGAAMNAGMMSNTAAASDSYQPAGYVPTVMISAAAGTGDDDGKVIFTLNFSDDPKPFSVASLSVSGAPDPKVADLVMATMAAEGYAATYTLTVTPNSDATEVKLSIAAGILGTMTGDLFFEGATGMHKLTPEDTTPDDTATGPLMGLSVPAKSYVIVAKTTSPMGLPANAIPANTAAGSSATTIKMWPGIPNLEDLFFRGGSLLLTTVKATKLDRDGKADTATEEAKERDVVITEIMAARNTALVGQAGYLDHQWIEIYNKLPVPVTVNLSSKSGRPAPSAADTEVRLDLVSNVVNPGWNFANLGADGVDDGDADTADLKPFVSFYRNNRGEPGWQQNRWTTSTNTYYANHKGTPGATERSGGVAVKATNPSYNVVINEIGNYSDDKYDWIELRNVNSGDGNIKKWQLWEITGDKKKSTILNMPDNDAHKIGAVGDVLLIVATDPYQDPNHPLAAGINITKDNGRAETTGVKSRYYVAGTGFKLANSGKTLLLLRSRNDGGDHEGIVDLTGTHFIQDTSNAFATDIWPLKGQTKGNDNHGHGDVVKGADEDLRSGHVYQRINAGRGTGKGVWERRGYTGVGYKRSAANNGQHGGTPGYDNGAVKVNEKDLADSAMVSISEIMYVKDRNLPQWIELYNSSMTQAVNLAEWKLKIEHSRDAEDINIRTTVTTNNLGGIIIQPNQTVLIVSNTTGRTSRAAQGGIDFPASRVINLWAQKDKLEVDSGVTRLSYKLLSESAFKLTLMDKAGTAVDVVGNLGADPAWELPMSDPDDGEGRSSIIRRYTDGEPDTGTMEDSWVFAVDSHLAWVRFNETYYGSPNDIGTPGFRAGGPLPVSLSKFRPERLDNGSIRIVWVTESELNNAGFNLLRSDARDGEFKQINTKLIAGQGTTSERTTYTHVDTSAKPNVVYYYQIQDVSIDGKVQTLRLSRLKGHVSPAGKITTTWGDIKALQ
ncbi:lamin tail domain-containing protein, partial [Candidatus Poribacteria bacterium]|nr:lamin tail domain-containing protein [Candidatus Poribacteria bacterium]